MTIFYNWSIFSKNLTITSVNRNDRYFMRMIDQESWYGKTVFIFPKRRFTNKNRKEKWFKDISFMIIIILRMIHPSTRSVLRIFYSYLHRKSFENTRTRHRRNLTYSRWTLIKVYFNDRNVEKISISSWTILAVIIWSVRNWIYLDLMENRPKVVSNLFFSSTPIICPM